MARRKTTRKRKTTRSTAARRKTSARRKKGSDKFVNFFVPLFLMVCIVGCIGLVLMLGFRSVSATSFFEIEKIETVGLKNVSEKLVVAAVGESREGLGVFDTDLDKIREKVAEIDYVRDVSVSRLLPGTIRVIVDERTPVALVQAGGEIRRVDADGKMLEVVNRRRPEDPAFILLGWEDDIAEEAIQRNVERLKIYQGVLDDWKKFDLVERVVAVDLVNPGSVKAIISDSGERITLQLGSEDFGTRLKDGIKHSAGNGKKISKIVLDGVSPVIIYRK
jgi:cell division septal protein FtsQ